MSFPSSLLPVLHLLISLPVLKMCEASLPSMDMNDLLFIERRSHSTFDLVQEFFNRTLLPLCDLTANACDINCCNDKDCSEEHLEAFSCVREPESFSVDPILSDSMYCHSNGSSPLADPILCYETQNSPFLGVYFMEDKILKRKSMEIKLEAMSPQKYFSTRIPDPPMEEGHYKHGVPLRFNRGSNGKDSMVNLPGGILGKGYCDFQMPIRFLEGRSSVCMSEMSEEQCVNSSRFFLETYFKESGGELIPPDIFKGGGGALATNVTVLCGHDIFEIEDFQVVSDVLEACGNTTNIRRTSFDNVRQVCQHVVTSVEYRFTWDGNALEGLDVVVALSEVSAAPGESRVPSQSRHPRVSQRFKAAFLKHKSGSRRRQRGGYNPNEGILLHHLS